MAFLLIGAGLIGAAGIWLLAAGAHGKPGANLDTAGMILLLHAPAIIAVRAAIGQNLLSATFANAACIGFLLGALIFSGDLALRAYTGHRLFPGAAPAGGLILLISWFAVAMAAALPLSR